MPIAEAPQGNKMHAVPQNIMDVEFKLIGDLTLRQFMYLFVFGGAAYVSSVVIVGMFKWPAVIFFAVIGIGLAFVPIQERGLDEWIVNFVRSVYSPTQRIWRRELTVLSAFMAENLAVVKQELITLAPTSSRRKLEEYLEYQVADTKVDPLDIPEREYMLKVREAFGDVTAKPSVGVGLIDTTPGIPQESFPPSAGYPQDQFATPSQQQELEPIPFDLPQSDGQQEKHFDVQEPQQETKDKAKVEDISEKSTEKPVESENVLEDKKQPEQPKKPEPVKQKPAVHGSPAHLQRHASRMQRRSSIALSPLTPDRHSGRRFINLVPTSGELVLPIRGERVIKTSEEVEVEKDIQDKAEKLQQLLAQIKMESTVGALNTTPAVPATPTPQVPQEPPVVPVVNKEAETLAHELEGEQKRLDQEISNLETQKTTSASKAESEEKDAMIQRLKVEKERTQSDYEALQRQILELQNKLKETNAQQTTVAQATPQSKPAAAVSGPPNILTGSVRSKTGTTKEGVLLIVKNQRGEAVRAVKTNSLGQFRLTTPLSNGTYTVEVTGDDIGSTFDIISIEVKGEPIPPVELFGR